VVARLAAVVLVAAPVAVPAALVVQAEGTSQRTAGLQWVLSPT